MSVGHKRNSCILRKGVVRIRMAATFYGLTAKLLMGETFNFSSLQGKVVLIENVASL